jgi:hypothetical protein
MQPKRKKQKLTTTSDSYTHRASLEDVMQKYINKECMPRLKKNTEAKGLKWDEKKVEKSAIPTVMNLDAIGLYLNDLGINPESPSFLIITGVTSCAYTEITKHGFISGWHKQGYEKLKRFEAHQSWNN